MKDREDDNADQPVNEGDFVHRLSVQRPDMLFVAFAAAVRHRRAALGRLSAHVVGGCSAA